MSSTDTIIKDLMGEADTLLLGLFSNALIGVYVIQDNRFLFANQRLADIFGYSQEELCGGMGPMDLMLPKDRPAAQLKIDQRIEGKVKASFYGFCGVRKDGRHLDIEVFGVATHFGGAPAIIGMLLDVSERCEAERAVADQLRFIGQLVDTIPSPVFFKDEDGRYLGCNTAFEHYLGIERNALIGRSVYDISPKDLADKYFAADRALFEQGGTQTYEAAVSYADGSRHDVVFYKASFNKADGQLGGLVGVILDISERKRMEQTIWHEANYDPLTGLPNRRLLCDRLREELTRARDKQQPLAVLFIDLDRFKEVNDTLGHDIGDLLLTEAGQRISTVLPESTTVSRQGGDEFVVVLPAFADKTMVNQQAQDIIDTLSRPFDLEGHQAYVSASVGIAFCPEDADQVDTLIRYADQAMYAAKAHNRNCFSHFKPSMQVAARQRHELSNDLRHALDNGEFAVHYQPIVDLEHGHIVKAEALLRWNHPQRGMVCPGEFIPLAEEIGIIGEIGNWVFRQATAAANRWRTLPMAARQGHSPIQISVNISPRQFIAGTCVGWIEHLQQLGLPPQLLSLEITEGLLLDDRPAVVDSLLAFREAGVEISIDDFGTGYSAMSYLKKFAIDYLKIDRSFVRDLTTDPSDLAIAEAVIVMAHKLGLKVIAEGVESEAQRDLLRQAGCDYAQGFLYSKALPEADFGRYLAAGNERRSAIQCGRSPSQARTLPIRSST